MKKILFLLAFLPLFGYGQIKVSNMTEATTVEDADLFLLVQSGSSKKVSFSTFNYGEAEVGTQIGDSLIDYRVEVANQIHDSIPVGNTVSIGADGQIPYTNSGGTDFLYSSNFTWNGVTLELFSGTSNLFVGNQVGSNNTGSNNSFFGTSTGINNIIGNDNTFIGSNTGYLNTSGNDNTFIGKESGHDNSSGNNNTFIGNESGYSTTSSDNVFIGSNTGYYNTTGSRNTFLGRTSGALNTTGLSNTFIGYNSGFNNSTGNYNIFLGENTGQSNSSGENNTFIGYNSGFGNIASNNSFFGFKSGYLNTTGINNSYIGVFSGYSNTTGSNNTYLGNSTGFNNDGSGNLFLGYQAGQNETTASNKLFISNSATNTLIYGEFDNDSLHFNANLTIDGNIYADNLTSFSATQYQIPYVNSSGGGFDFSSNFTWNDTTLGVNDGNNNIFIGNSSGGSIIGGVSNTFVGDFSGSLNSIGDKNTFIGKNAGISSNADNNVYLGFGAGFSSSTGANNTFVGTRTGESSSSGSSNVFVGYLAGGTETGSNKLYIENSNSTSPLIYGEFDNDYVQINDSLKVTKSITLGENTDENYKAGKLYYDTTDQALTFFNDQSDFKWQLSREIPVRYYNNTGSTITNGTLLRSLGAKVNGSITFVADLAGNFSLDSLQGIAMATVNVLDGEYGEATLVGQVNGLNTSMFSDNDLLWVGCNGTVVNSAPAPPQYSAIIGRVVYADADSGAIFMFPIGETKYSPIPGASISFSRESETIINPGISTPTLITNVTNDLYTTDYDIGFSVVGDTLSPSQNGIYSISGDFAYQGDAATGDDWRVGIFVNGVEKFSVLRTTSASNKGVVALSKLLSLNSTDWVSFKIENTTSATRDAIFTDGVINIEYITSQ